MPISSSAAQDISLIVLFIVIMFLFGGVCVLGKNYFFISTTGVAATTFWFRTASRKADHSSAS